jgi:hypothetical protein
MITEKICATSSAITLSMSSVYLWVRSARIPDQNVVHITILKPAAYSLADDALMVTWAK